MIVTIDVNAIGTLLQDTLVELIDLSLQGKQAHWNLTGPRFKFIHEQLDELVEALRQETDTVAERAVAIGYRVDGRLSSVAKETPLPELPSGPISDDDAVTAFTERLATVIGHARGRIAKLEQLDPVSQDTLINLTATLEKYWWMFREQVQRT